MGMQFEPNFPPQGRRRLQRVRVTAAYTAQLSDKIIAVGTDTAAITITLPSAAALLDGHFYVVKDEDGNAGTNTITVATEGSETIDEASTDTIVVNFDSRGYYSNGTNWFII